MHGLGWILYNVVRRKNQKKCTRCGLYTAKDTEKCSHCGDLDPFEFAKFTELRKQYRKSNRNLGKLFLFLAILIGVLLVLTQ